MNTTRLAFRALMAALLGAISMTVAWLYPDIPAQIVAAWMAVGMAASGFGESLYDRGTTSVPNNAAPAEVEAILAPKRPPEMAPAPPPPEGAG